MLRSSPLLQLAPSSDLRSILSPIEDQGQLGSCTAHGVAACIEANEHRRWKLQQLGVAALPTVTTGAVSALPDGSIAYQTVVHPPATPQPTPAPTPAPAPIGTRLSRLYQYYNSRLIEGTTGTDSGASVRDAVAAAAKYGCLDEALYPYDIAKFTQIPTTGQYDAASKHKVTSYHALADGDLAAMKTALLAGYPVVFGFQVYSYFMSQDMATHGVARLPQAGEQLEGGHCTALVGHDDSKAAFLVRNSWSANWGLSGYFWMPYAYVSNARLASDFWLVQSQVF